MNSKDINSELTDKNRADILKIANTNLLVGIIKALDEQIDYLSSREFKGRQKFEFTVLRNAANNCVKSWSKESKEAENEADRISAEFHDMLYRLREKTVKKYTDFALDIKE